MMESCNSTGDIKDAAAEEDHPSRAETEIIMETPTKLMLRKDQLSNANCCRLCAQGVEVDVENIQEFIPLFKENDNSIHSTSTPVNRLINKYLPIEVLESDSVYPKVICQACFNCMEKTIEFFDKIFEGQRLLANILNCLTNKTDNNKSVKHSSSPKGPTFSQENPLFKAAKRRGRPKKQPTTFIKEMPTSPTTPNPSITSNTSTEKMNIQLPENTTERRTKRQSRPPVRYVDEVIPNTFKNDVVMLEEEEEEDNFNNNEEEEYMLPGPSSSEMPSNKPNFVESNETDGGSYINYSISSSAFSLNQHQMMDLGKLNMFMANDEEVISIIPTDNKNSNLTTITTESNPTTSSSSLVIVVENNNEDDGGLNDKYNLDVELKQQQQVKKDEATDKTVKLHNFYRTTTTTRKPVSRKTKKKKRGTTIKNTADTPKIQCEQCPKTFNHNSSLLYHRLSVHDKTKDFVCNICGRGFAHKQLLNSHKYTHTDDKYFNCETCPAKFKSRASLYTHKKSRHSSVKEHTCEVCGSQFSLKSSLVGHMRLHTGEKPFQCDLCEKSFAQRSSLREHRRIHTGEKPYVCEHCSKSFTTGSQLRCHKFCHSNEKVLLCQICGKGFSHVENFRYHMRRHANEKPVVCPICKKRFVESWTFKKHMRLHTNEKPYTCPTCNKQFSDPSNFKRHVRVHEQKIETSFAETDPSMEEYFLSETANAVKDSHDLSIGGDGTISTTNIATTSGGILDGAIMGDDEDDEATSYVTTDGTTVQILDNNNLTYRAMTQEDEVEQVIYVYSTGGGPLFTFAMADDEAQSESHEVIAIEDDHEGVGDNIPMDVGTLSTALESFNPNDMESHYYSLERVGESTIAVPIQMPLSAIHNSGNSIISHHSQQMTNNNQRMLSGTVAIEVDNISLLEKDCGTEST